MAIIRVKNKNASPQRLANNTGGIFQQNLPIINDQGEEKI